MYVSCLLYLFFCLSHNLEHVTQALQIMACQIVVVWREISAMFFQVASAPRSRLAKSSIHLVFTYSWVSQPSSTGILAQIILWLWWGACILGCLVPSVASTPLDASSTRSQSCSNQKCLQTIPNIPWGKECPLLKTTDLESKQDKVFFDFQRIHRKDWKYVSLLCFITYQAEPPAPS